jgi:hypothetical protein
MRPSRRRRGAEGSSVCRKQYETRSGASAAAPLPADGYAADATVDHVSVLSVLAVVTLTIAAGVAAGYGFNRHSAPWLVASAALVAPILVVGAHAGARVESAPRAAALAVTAVLLFLFIVSIVVSEQLWDSATATSDSPAYRLAADTPDAHVYLRAKPGGPELTGRNAPAPLSGGHDYYFSCSVTLGDSTQWLRSRDSGFWAPAIAFRSTSADGLPEC